MLAAALLAFLCLLVSNGQLSRIFARECGEDDNGLASVKPSAGTGNPGWQKRKHGLVLCFASLHQPGKAAILASIHRKFRYWGLKATHTHQTKVYDPVSSGSSGGSRGGGRGGSGGGGRSSGGGADTDFDRKNFICILTFVY